MSNFELLQSRWARLQEEYKGQGVLDHIEDKLDNDDIGIKWKGSDVAAKHAFDLIDLVETALIDDLSRGQGVLFARECWLSYFKVLR